MFAKPQSQHHWLDQLVGDWNIEHHCQMTDGSNAKTHGKMTCRSLGGMWLISESVGVSPEGEAWSSIMTVGFDTALERFSCILATRNKPSLFSGVFSPNRIMGASDYSTVRSKQLHSNGCNTPGQRYEG